VSSDFHAPFKIEKSTTDKCTRARVHARGEEGWREGRRTEEGTDGEENPGYGKRISRVWAPVGDAEEMVFLLIRRQEPTGSRHTSESEGERGGGGTSAGKIPARSARERGIPQEDRAERKNGEAAAEEGRGRVGGGGEIGGTRGAGGMRSATGVIYIEFSAFGG